MSINENWYSIVGTLHNATVSEWQAASSLDRLATAADFVAANASISSFSELRLAATSLMSQIAIACDGASPSHYVSEIAAAIRLLEVK